jgi:hypothetical protein
MIAVGYNREIQAIGVIVMCGNDHIEFVWTLRDRETGRPFESSHGFTYVFETEDEAREFIERTSLPNEVEIVQVPQGAAA